MQTGPVWAAMWTQFLWLPLVGSMLGGWCAAAVWRSGAVACAALAGLDERYGARSRRRIEIPTDAAGDGRQSEGRGVPTADAHRNPRGLARRAGGACAQDHSHIEEELSEGDIQGSFAHGI